MNDFISQLDPSAALVLGTASGAIILAIILVIFRPRNRQSAPAIEPSDDETAVEADQVRRIALKQVGAVLTSKDTETVKIRKIEDIIAGTKLLGVANNKI